MKLYLASWPLPEGKSGRSVRDINNLWGENCISFSRLNILMSAAAHLLRLWVHIPPGAWIFVCFECCCVLSGRGLCDELFTRPEESYRLWCVFMCELETSWMRRPWTPLGGCCTKRKIVQCFIFSLLFGRDEDLPVFDVKVCKTSRRLLSLVPERGAIWEGGGGGGSDWSNSRTGLFTAGKRTPGTFEEETGWVSQSIFTLCKR
jgi:hypothetical protein